MKVQSSPRSVEAELRLLLRLVQLHPVGFAAHPGSIEMRIDQTSHPHRGVQNRSAPTPDDENPLPATFRSTRVVGRLEFLALAAILVVATVLNFFRLDQLGYANTYYAAAVKSMLASWHNFFFVSFDPGGFVTVDKPPLGFWLQTASAKLFGFHGWSLLLPQALAGVASVFVLFLLVRRAFGPIAGLIAAAALALTPVAVADNRNNTVDSLLVLSLLLATWTVLKATERGRLRWLLGGMALVGLGFNIKMLEAYLALPALAAIYFLGAPIGWRIRTGHLGLGAGVLLAVSLSWAVAVDLTPPGQRPYVGSSQHNSELELAFSYNGLQRLLGGGLPFNTLPPAVPATIGNSSESITPFAAPPGGSPFVQGGPSPLRMLDEQLGGQASWLLTFALFGLVAGAIMTTPRRPRFSRSGLQRVHLNDGQVQLVLWSIWLAVVGGFFSVAGFFHPYYLITLAPPVAALTGIGMVALWRLARREGWIAWLLPSALLVGAATQIYLLEGYPLWNRRLVPALLALCLAGAALAALAHFRPQLLHPVLPAAVALGLTGLLLTPAVWSVLTVTQDAGMAGILPSGGPFTVPAFSRPSAPPLARPGSLAELPSLPSLPADAVLPGGLPPPSAGFPGPGGVTDNGRLIDYLEANRGPERFLLAVPEVMSASSIIIQTGQPVMAMGGFTGSDPILTSQDLARDVKHSVVRFFLVGGPPGPGGAVSMPALSPLAGAQPPAGLSLLPQTGGPLGGQDAPQSFPFPPGPQSALTTWVTEHCTAVPASAWQETASAIAFGSPLGQQLYDCVHAGYAMLTTAPARLPPASASDSVPKI